MFLDWLHWTWKILYWGWFASEVYLLIRARARSQSGHRLRDRGSLIILWGTIATCMTVGLSWGDSHPPSFPSFHHSISILALILFILGLVVRWWAILTLGRAFSVNVALHSDQHVIQTGLFRVVRHPSYLGMVILFCAVGLAERSYAVMAIILIPISIALAYRIHVEEVALREGFGQEYIEYSKRTKRLIPFIY